MTHNAQRHGQRDLLDLYNRHSAGLFFYAQSLTGDPAQAVFVKLLLRPPVSTSPLEKSFLYTILRNRIYDEGRKKKVRNRRPPVPVAVAKESIPSETLQDIAQALESLPEVQREIITLRFYAGLSFPEISEVVSAPVDTVKSRHRYALQKLAEELQ